MNPKADGTPFTPEEVEAILDEAQHCNLAEIRRLNEQLRVAREALQEIVHGKPKEKPDWHDAHDSGNYDDCESNGYELCAWENAEIAEKALALTEKP